MFFVPDSSCEARHIWVQLWFQIIATQWVLKDSWLVVESYPSEKYEDSSIGMIIPNFRGKMKHVPNHQLDSYFILYFDFVWLQYEKHGLSGDMHLSPINLQNGRLKC